MIRKQIYLTEAEVSIIETKAAELNISGSEYIRRVLDASVEEYYFFSYKYRTNRTNWVYEDEAINIHPVKRINELRQEDTDDYVLLFYKEISKEIYDKYKK